MDAFDDRALWLAYETSSSDQERRRIGGEIVAMHMGFLRQYAAKTAFPFWDEQVREDYLQELCLVALAKVPLYDRTRRGHEQKTATFPTFIRKHLLDVRWRVAGREEAFSTGKETRRMIADVHFLQWKHLSAGLEPPTLEELAEHLSLRHGKTVSPGRIQRLISRPYVESVDATDAVTGDDLHSLMRDLGPGPEALVVEAAEAAELEGDVSRIVARLDPLDRAIVFGRLMDQTCSQADIAARFGIAIGAVRDAERDLVERLRDLLGDYRSGS